jgi:hypothetical protein
MPDGKKPKVPERAFAEVLAFSMVITHLEATRHYYPSLRRANGADVALSGKPDLAGSAPSDLS